MNRQTFPDAVERFTQVVDGIDIICAHDINRVYDIVEAIQAYLLEGGYLIECPYCGRKRGWRQTECPSCGAVETEHDGTWMS